MHSLNIHAMQWQPVADISAVDPLLPADLACFRELRDVLQRYGALDRFGISLIHRHFDIADDEELMEYTDVEERTLTVKPVKKSDIDWQHAFSAPNWTPIPRQTGHPVQRKLDTDSAPNWTV